MQIPKGVTVAVVINRNWANLHGVRFFLSQNQAPQVEVRGKDESYIVFAKVLDSEDSRGLWIELNTDKHRENPDVECFSFLVPWSEIFTVVIAEQFSSAIRDQAKKIGSSDEVGIG